MSIKLVNPSAKSTVFPDILARLQETSREGDWWSRKSEKEQDRYLKDHPNSKKAKELRQQKHGKQSSEDPDAMRDDRMFGEHTDDNKSTERPPEPKKKLVDTNPDNTELKMPPVEEPKGAEAEQPKEGLVSVNPDNTKLEIPPINSPMAEDKEGEKQGEEQQAQPPTSEAPEQPDPTQFIDDVGDQLAPKEAEDKVSKEFFKKKDAAQGPDLQHYEQMERIWNRTHEFENNGMVPEEFTKDSLMFRGKRVFAGENCNKNLTITALPPRIPIGSL
jgi:hypothetical protein